MPSSVMMAEVAGGTLNSSAANFNTAVNGAPSGTVNTLKGSLGSLVSVMRNDTLEPDAIFFAEFEKLCKILTPKHEWSNTSPAAENFRPLTVLRRLRLLIRKF